MRERKKQDLWIQVKILKMFMWLRWKTELKNTARIQEILKAEIVMNLFGQPNFVFPWVNESSAQRS